jgi:hypothetical protein
LPSRSHRSWMGRATAARSIVEMPRVPDFEKGHLPES